MTALLRITEALDLDLDAERWRCNRCGTDLGAATANYKEACLLYDRDPRDIHGRFPGDPEFSFSPHPEWCRIVEVYCPSCATMLDVEYLPPGHPPTHDIELDLDALRLRRAEAESPKDA
jgi:acetophenone carboxylase